MSFVNFYNKILLCTGRSKAPLTKYELFMSVQYLLRENKRKNFDQTLHYPNSDNAWLNISKLRAQVLKQLHLWVEGIKYCTKIFDLQL